MAGIATLSNCRKVAFNHIGKAAQKSNLQRGKKKLGRKTGQSKGKRQESLLSFPLSFLSPAAIRSLRDLSVLLKNYPSFKLGCLKNVFSLAFKRTLINTSI